MKKGVNFKYYTDASTTALVCEIVDYYNRKINVNEHYDKSVRMHDYDFVGTKSYFVACSLFGYSSEAKNKRHPFNNELNLKIRLQ